MSGSSIRRPGVVFHATTANRKLAPVVRVAYPHKDFKFRQEPRAPFCSATYVSIDATCSDACSFKGHGCYVQQDRFMSRAVARLDAEAADLAGFGVALNEVEVIDQAFPAGVPQDGARGGRDLRLHVGGDTPTRGAAALLGEAAQRWRERGGGDVWTFTHGWRDLRRRDFGPALSVLASVESPAEAMAAAGRGFAPAPVVDTFPGRAAFDVGGVRVVPCPNETRGKTCVECRLCLDDRALVGRGVGIAFAAHGRGAEQVRAALVQLGTRRSAA